MAVSDWDNFSSVTREKAMPKVYDQIGKDQVIFNRLWKPKEWSGGRAIQATVKFAMNSQGGSYAGLEVLNATKETTRTRADWGRPRQLYQPVVFDNLDIALNKNEQFFDLVDQEMAEMKDSLQDKVCTQLHGDGTGNSNKNLLGLIAGADDGSNVGTYGGIVRSTYTWLALNSAKYKPALILENPEIGNSKEAA